MNPSLIKGFSFTIVVVAISSALCFDMPASAGGRNQNANSSMTMPQNANSAATRADNSSMAPSEQTDLSGTYTGVFDCPDAGVSGETTLTITGNQFTLSDGKTGRITAVTTRGYTGVAMQFGESTPGSTPVIVSMRARKVGDRLTLSAVADSGRVCSFMPAGSRRRTRRVRTAAPAAPETMPATEPTPAPSPSSTPAAPTPDTMPMTAPTPAASPTPTPPAK